MKRGLGLTLAAVLVFAVVAAILLRFMPQPMKDSDYLVVGSVGTLAALLMLFFVLAASKPGTFVKKRRKQ